MDIYLQFQGVQHTLSKIKTRKSDLGISKKSFENQRQKENLDSRWEEGISNSENNNKKKIIADIWSEIVEASVSGITLSKG